MKYKFAHFNFNVLDLDKSIAFYKQNLGLNEMERKKADDGSFELVFLGDGKTDFQLELTCLRDQKKSYDLGDNEIHLAMEVDDFKKSYEFHKSQGVVCFENKEMGVYFISDPDGYWTEIVS
jgi:lactoylglutathione lyase